MVASEHDLKARAIGHACLVLYREGANPLLLTDPVACRLRLLAKLVVAELSERR